MDKGDDAHLRFALGALERIHFIDSLYARGPSTLTELFSIVTLRFFGRRRGELSAFSPSPTGVSTVVSCDAFIGLRDMNRERCQKLQSVKLPPPHKATGDRYAKASVTLR